MPTHPLVTQLHFTRSAFLRGLDGVTAEEARRIKLVNQVLPRDALFPEAERLARKIASNPASAVRAAKRAVVRGMEMSLVQGLALEARLAAGLRTDGS